MTDPVARLRELLAKATPGPWMVQDGCSWRRIGTHSHDGDVLCPTNQNDGHPDLIASDGKRDHNLRLIVAAVNALPGLLDHFDAAEKRAGEAEDELQSALAVRLPDWMAWTKDLRKAATKDQEPLDDERMDLFRHAVADNHTKSTAAERDDAKYRVGRFAGRYGSRIIARIDAAEAQATALAARCERLEAALRDDAIPMIKEVIEHECMEEGVCSAWEGHALCASPICNSAGCIVDKLTHARAAIDQGKEG